MISALFVVPIAALVYLFVAQSSQDISFAEKEIAGTQYLTKIWPNVMQVAQTGDVSIGAMEERRKYDHYFNMGDASAAFVESTDVATKLAAGKTLIGAIADRRCLAQLRHEG